jgi:hypothetical protein
MKFNGRSSQILCNELRRNFSADAKKLNSLLRNPVTVLTTWSPGLKQGRRERSRIYFEPPEWRFKISCENPRSFIKLCCMSWYLDDDIGCLLRLELEKQVNRFGPEYRTKIELCLTTEPEMIIYILESDVLGKNPNEVFGNIRANKPRIRILVYNAKRSEFSFYGNSEEKKLFQFISTSVKRPQFHRGYRDKGSLRTGSEYLHEQKKDFSATELQNQIEEQREIQRDTVDFCRGFME